MASSPASSTTSSVSNRRRHIKTQLEEDSQKAGISVGSGIEWRNWEPGTSYPRRIVVRNISQRTVQFKYKLPKTKYFMMPFPEKTTLCAGMTTSIEVVFRPVKKEQYVDDIVFSTKEGSISLPIRAVLKEVKLDVPSEPIKFGYCPVRETTSIPFTVANVGELEAWYRWDVDAPFSVTPDNGSINPGAKIKFQASFDPTEAVVANTLAVIVIDGPDGSTTESRISFEGVGKYPHITADRSYVNFGNISMRKTVEEDVIITNTSIVRTSYRIKRRDRASGDTSLSFDPKKGVLNPREQVKVHIKYSPTIAGVETAETLEVKTMGGNRLDINCRGKAVGPEVSLSASSVNFGQIPLGKSSKRIIQINNSADSPATYSFHTPSDGVFSFTSTNGTLRPKSSQQVVMRFNPKMPINYYRRVMCVVYQQCVLHVDLIGNGYNDDLRPAPVFQRHVNRFRERERNGLSRYGPEQLEGKIEKAASLNDTFDDVEDVEETVDDNDEEYVAARTFATFTEFCLKSAVDDTESQPVSLHVRHLDVGSVMSGRSGVPRDVNFFNRTKGKVTVNWQVPSHSQHVFAISPASLDVAPDSAAQFQLLFTPIADNQSYACELECVASFKTMRNFRLVTEETICPPWTLPLLVSGNSVADSDRFTPEINVTPTHMLFPPCHVGSSSFQTLRLKNTGDTVVTYKFHVPSPYSVFPSSGFIRGKCDSIVVVQFKPSDAENAASMIRVVFNGVQDTAKDIRVVAKGQVPRIEIKSIRGEELFFRPTAVNHTTVQDVIVRNPCQLSVQYIWSVPEKHSKVIVVEPSSGVLAALESTKISVSFNPTSDKLVTVPITCAVVSAQAVDSFAEVQNLGTSLTGGFKAAELADADTLRSIASTARQQVMESATANPAVKLTVKGEGVDGMVKICTSHLDLGAVLMLTEKQVEITIQNTSDAFTYYCTRVTRLDAHDDSSVTRVSVVPESGPLPPKRKQTLTIVLCPGEPKKFGYRIDVLQCDKRGNDLINSTMAGSCDVLFHSDIPRLFVSDVRSVGHSTHTLWQRLSIDRLNTLFSHNLDVYEMYLADDDAVLPPHEERSEMESLKKRLSTVVLDVIGSEQGSPDTEVHLLLENRGPLPTEYNIMFPRQIETQLEHWADLGLPTALSERQDFIEENDVFAVTPSRGMLEANGGTQMVTIRYSHRLAGDHDITVLFAIKHGHHVLINIKGTAHTRGAPRLEPIRSFSEPYTLAPVSLGESSPPIQRYQLHNVGLVALDYDLNVTPLADIAAANYDYRVFKCLNPTGFLAAGSKTWIKWQFDPIEEKEYTIDVPIEISAVHSAMIKGHQPKSIAVQRETIKLIGRGELSHDDHDHDDVAKPRSLTSLSEASRGLTSVDEDEEDSDVLSLGPPIQQMLPLEGQVIELSYDRVDFGSVPTHASSSRLVVIRNRSLRHEVEYRWDAVSEACEGLVSFKPSRGRIEPDGVCMCRVMISGGFTPLYVDFDAICYARVVDQPKKSSAPQQVTHVTHEDEVDEILDMNGSFDTTLRDRKRVLKERLSVSARMPTSNAVLSHRAELQSMTRGVSALGDNDAVVETESDFDDQQSDRSLRPSASATLVRAQSRTILHLSPHLSPHLSTVVASDNGLPIYLHVTASIVSVSSVDTRSLSHFFIPLHENESTVPEFGEPHEHEKMIFESILNDLLRDIARDPFIKDIVESLPNAPIPFFQQLRPTDHDDDVDEGPDVDHQFVSIVEQVLENTIMNLMAEAVHGEFDLVSPPKKFVVKKE